MKKILFAIVALLITTSCEKLFPSGVEHSWSRSFSVTMVTTGGINTVPFEEEATITLTSPDITEPVLNISIEGARFVSMMPKEVNFDLEGLSYKLYDNNGDNSDPLTGAWVITRASVIPKIGGLEREDWKMLNFRATITNTVVLEFEVEYGGERYHSTFGKLEEEEIWEASHTLDVQTASEALGTFDDEAKITFVQKNLMSNKFDITVEDIQFATQMPNPITFCLKDVNFVEIIHNEWGKVKSFNIPTIAPYINNEQSEMYTFTDVRGIVSDEHVEISMKYGNFTVLMTKSTL